MFGSIDRKKGLLFCSDLLDQVLSKRLLEMQRNVELIDSNQFLNTSAEDLKRYLVEKCGVTPIRLMREEQYVDSQEKMIDVRHDPMRRIRDRSRPVLKPGERIEIRVPFEGESELFYARPDAMTSDPPQAIVDKTNGELVFSYEYPADSPMDVLSQLERTLGNIEQYLTWQRKMLDSYNNKLPDTAEQTIQQRRDRLLAQSKRVAALGIPIKRRTDAPTTYAIPTNRKRVLPIFPQASVAPFVPEPTWAMDQYEQALKIMQDMALVMERSPEAFRTMDEEALRQHFLVQLNGQFEGKATGETFNMSGKTDILLREGERNVFIAECKFWRGPKALGEAVDQLLGYATWRDGKAVILVFNRGTDTSVVLSGINTILSGHSNFKRAMDWPHESGFRYVLHANGDTNRELILTVLVFHVPH